MIKQGRFVISLGALVLLVAWVVNAGRVEGEAQGTPTPDLQATVDGLTENVGRQAAEIVRLHSEAFGTVTALQATVQAQGSDITMLKSQMRTGGQAGSSARSGDVVTISATMPVVLWPNESGFRCDIAANPEKAQYPASPAYVLICR